MTVTPSRLQSNQRDRIGDLKNVHEKFLDILYPFIVLMVIFMLHKLPIVNAALK